MIEYVEIQPYPVIITPGRRTSVRVTVFVRDASTVGVRLAGPGPAPQRALTRQEPDVWVKRVVLGSPVAGAWDAQVTADRSTAAVRFPVVNDAAGDRTRVLRFRTSQVLPVAGQTITFRGALLRRSDQNWQPAGAQPVGLYFRAEETLFWRLEEEAHTAPDGTFAIAVPAVESGAWHIEFDGAPGLFPCRSRVVETFVQPGAPGNPARTKIRPYNVTRQTIAGRRHLIHEGTLKIKTNRGWLPYRNHPMVICFLPDKASSWRKGHHGTTDGDGRFTVDIDTQKRGKWRALVKAVPYVSRSTTSRIVPA